MGQPLRLLDSVQPGAHPAPFILPDAASVAAEPLAKPQAAPPDTHHHRYTTLWLSVALMILVIVLRYKFSASAEGVIVTSAPPSAAPSASATPASGDFLGHYFSLRYPGHFQPYTADQNRGAGSLESIVLLDRQAAEAMMLTAILKKYPVDKLTDVPDVRLRQQSQNYLAATVKAAGLSGLGFKKTSAGYEQAAFFWIGGQVLSVTLTDTLSTLNAARLDADFANTLASLHLVTPQS